MPGIGDVVRSAFYRQGLRELDYSVRAKPVYAVVMSMYHHLEVWKVAHALVLNVHSHAKGIRGGEYISLKSQMLRAAMSVPTNLVEGSGQESAREFCRFIRIALNSSSELEYHLLLAKDLGVLKSEAFKSLSDQTVKVRKMLWGLLKGVSRRAPAQKRPAAK